MSTTIVFPHISKDENADGVLATWFVKTGEQVKKDQLLAEVMVDKVSLEVPAPCDGIITLLVAEEASVKQGVPIAQIYAQPHA